LAESSGADAQSTDPLSNDALELELRQLAGVRLVSIAGGRGPTLVEIAADPAADVEELRDEARSLVLGHIDGGDVSVQIVGTDPPSVPSRSDRRVRLLLTVPLAGEPFVAVHLAHRDRRAMVEAPVDDRLAVATAVIEGLRALGLAVRHEAASAHGLPDELGAGTLVVLRDPRTGLARRGLATGRDTADATARAVLNSLNRLLPELDPDGPPP
jgi:hypothetical protein